MASKKKGQLTKQCRIFQWVESQDPDFACAIRDLCLEGALAPGRAGVTFLYPRDKTYRAEIVEKAYSSDADAAVKLIESLVIPLALIQGSDFTRQSVGSKLGVKYVVESATPAKVSIAEGVELVPAEGFSPLATRVGQIAVWVVAKGRLPLEGAAYEPPAPKREDGRGRARHGGAEPSERQLLAARVEDAFGRCMRRDRCVSHHPYLASVVSLLNYMKLKCAETLAMVMPILDYDPIVCFYLLLEPYKTQGVYLIPDSVLFGDNAWNGVEIYSAAVTEYEAMFRSMQNQSALAATDPQSGSRVVPYVFRDPAAVAALIDNARQVIGKLNPRTAPTAVQTIYNTLCVQNRIQGLGPVLPDATLAALGDGRELASDRKNSCSDAKKLWQDELRFTLHEALQEMRQSPSSSDTFATIVRDLRTAWPGNNYRNETRLSNAADLVLNVSPRTELLLLIKFVNSSDFLYIPVSPEAVGPPRGGMDPTDWEPYNRNAVALRVLRQTTGMVRPAGISPQALQEVLLYAQAHGRLPSDIQVLCASSPNAADAPDDANAADAPDARASNVASS